MEGLRPIFWGQGMFLQPQHFQQQDRYHQRHVRRALELLAPYCWGVHSLDIEPAALRAFRFEIAQCELLTWEGTLLRLEGNALSSNARLLPRDVEAALDPGGRPLGVYLGVKRQQGEPMRVERAFGPGGVADQPQRFSLHERTTPDLFASDGHECSVHYLCYELHLLFDNEVAQRQDYELVKIAELLRATEGQGAVLSRRYIPPCVNVHASPVLAGMLKEVRDLLTAKGRELSEYKRQYNLQAIEMGSRDTVFLLMMQTVNRYIPLFHHALEGAEAHPYPLYALLRQLIGELSTFSDTVSALGGPLPAYRHDRLWECFDPAVRLARELLNELTKGPDNVVNLTFDGEYFTAKLEKPFFDGNPRYYLAIKADMPPRELLRLLADVWKIGPREDMATLRQQALPGLRVDYLELPPEELPRRAHCSYFLVDHHASLWRRITQHQNIAVYCELPSEQVSMQLLVLAQA